MKHILFLFLLSATSLSFAQQKSTSYIIEGNLTDSASQGKTLYIERYDDRLILDSAKVENGHFQFKGKTDAPYFCRINAGRKYGNLIIENGAISVDMEDSHLASGTPLNDQLKEHEASIRKIYDELRSERIKIDQMSIDNSQKEKLKEKLYLEQYQPTVLKLRLQLFNQHNNDPIGEYLIRSLSSEASPEDMDKVFAQAGEWLMSLNSSKKIKKQIEALRQTSVGKMFIDFEGKDENDQPLKLSAFVGKGNYTLVDFWASWCGPCREETPTIAKVYEQFKDKGLQVIGVATWDKPAHTKKAMKELNITWKQIFDAGMKPMELYGINGIPQIMLFGPDGTIIARDLRGEKISEKVKEALKL